jgi:molybdopterin-binding protein
MKLSARNQLTGTVIDINEGTVTTTVKIELKGGDVITSSITKEAATELGVAVGTEVTAIVKASSVMLAVE